MACTSPMVLRPRPLLLRLAPAAAVAASTLTGCGDPSSDRTVPPLTDTSTGAAVVPATVPGLAAAVLKHLEGRAAAHGGNANESEKWMAVDLEVDTAGRGPVPLSVMVVETGDDLDPSSVDSCPTADTVLHCRVDHAPDGSPVVAMTSTEDIVGGLSPDGLFVFVSHTRDDHVVLVIEELPSRRRGFVTMRRLPVPLDVLTAIATDPLVATTTTKHLDDAGRRLPAFAPEDGP